MRTSGGRRRMIAAILIAVLVLGLTLVLIFAGLPTAANVVQILGVVAIATPLIAWARAGTKTTPIGDRTLSGDQQKRPESLDLPDPLADLPEFSTRQRLAPPITGVAFRSPIPWAQWSAFLLLVISVSFAIVALWIGNSNLNDPGGGWYILGFMLVLVLASGIIIDILAAAFGEQEFHLGTIFRKIFASRLMLVISDKGIRYRWNSKRDFSCSWQDVYLITSDTRPDSHAHLVVILADRTGEHSSKLQGPRISLCELDSPGFPTDEIRAVIATYQSARLDLML